MPNDTGHKAVEELKNVSRELAEFGHRWAEDTALLRAQEVAYEIEFAKALLTVKDEPMTVKEKEAKVVSMLSDKLVDLAVIQGRVEAHKAKFRVLDRRAGNAQSILRYHEAETRVTGMAGA